MFDASEATIYAPWSSLKSLLCYPSPFFSAIIIWSRHTAGGGLNSIKNAIFSLIRAGMWYRLISEYRGQGCIRASPLSCKYLTVGARNAHSTHRSMHAVRSYARLYSARINNETNIAYRILNFHITRYRIHLAIAAEYFKIKL